jgi:hypothetical protein
VINHISIQALAEYRGYSLQYIRRLLRSGKQAGLKTNQVWLINKMPFEVYLEKANHEYFLAEMQQKRSWKGTSII